MRLSFRLMMAWLVALSFACTDQGTGPSIQADATLALLPSFSAAGAAQATRAIHRIRLEARAEGTTVVLLRTVVDVDPGATSWSVPLDVPFVPGRRIVVTIELMHVAPNGAESVEWSGITAPISLIAGATIQNGVTVFPGPLDNLQVRSLTLQDAPAEMLEDDTGLLRAVVDAPAGLAVRVFWTSTNPEAMSVDSTGAVRALLPGSTRIIAVAGPFADTATILVRARARTIEVTPATVVLEQIGAESQLTGRVLDARGEAVPGATVTWSVSDAAVLQHVGGGLVRALATGTATVTATSPEAPGLSGVATVEVVQVPAAISVSPDVVVLTARGATAPLSAVIEDAGGTVISGLPVSWSIADPAVATVSADGVVTAAGDGATTITATAAGLSADVQLTVARTPARFEILAGNGQSAAAGTAVEVAPAVRVDDANGHALPGIDVAFNVITGGGTVELVSATSDGGGVASAGGWTLGTRVGENRVTAAISGLAPLTFTATAVAGAPTAITGVAGDDQTATVGTAVPVAPAVRVTDRHGNLVPGVTVALTAGGSGSSIAPAMVQTDADGVAAATSWQLGTVIGTYTAHATVVGVGSVVFTATAEVGAPAHVEMVRGDGQTATVGTTLPVSPAVRVTDAHGNVVAGVQVTFRADAGTLSPATVETDADGIASATSWQLGSVAGTHTAVATVDGVGSVAFTATAEVGAPASIQIVAGDGQTAAVGTTVTVAPAVRVTDRHGNPVAGATVNFSSAAGSTHAGTAETDAAGVATAGAWELGTVAGDQTLVAAVADLPVVTFTATAHAGPAAAMDAITEQSQSGVVGAQVAELPTVRVTDAYGNAVAGIVVSFAVDAGSVAEATAGTDASGEARIAGWTLGTVSGPQTLTASAEGLPGIVFTVEAVAGPAANVVAHAGDGQTGSAGEPVGVLPAVLVTDQFGNVVEGVDVDFEIGTGGGTVTPASVVTDAAGAAAVDSWTLGAEPGENTLIANVGELTVTFTATAEPVHGEPFAITPFAGLDQTALPGTAVAVAPAVAVTDEQGGAVPGATVTFAVHQGGGSITGESAVTDAEGIARVGSWTLGSEPAVNVLSAAVAGIEPVFVHATGTTGLPAAVIISAGNGQSAPAGTAVAVAPAVAVLDDLERVMPGVTVTFAVASGGGSITGETAVTAGDGLAAVGSWTLGAAAGENTLTATAGDVVVAFTATAVIDVDLCAPVAITIGTNVQAELSPNGCVVDEVPVANFSLELTAQTAFSLGVTGSPAFSASINGPDGIVYAVAVDAAAGFDAALVLPAGSYSLALAYTGGDPGTVTLATSAGLPAACTEIVTARGVVIANALSATDCSLAGELQQFVDTYVLIAPPGVTTQWSVAADIPVQLALASELSDGPLAVSPVPSVNPVLTLTNTTAAPLVYIAQVIAGQDEATGAYTLSILDVDPPAMLAASAGGDAQSADAGQPVAVPPAVIVRDAGEVPVAGVPVTFTVASGGGTITGGTPVSATSNVVYTDHDGEAALDSWTLGATPGTNTVVAGAAGVTGTVTFTATGAAADPLMMIELVDRTFVGVSFSALLRVTLNQPAPAGGLVVSVFSDDISRLTIAAPGTITIAEGATSGTIAVNGEAAGTAPVRAVATGFPDASASIVVSLRLISLPTTLNVPFGHNASLPVQLAEPAPEGGTVVTLTSSDPTLVEVLTPTVTVLAGATTANATVYGALPGPATLTATATEYIAGSSAATTRAELEVRTTGGGSTLFINEVFGGQIRLRLRSAGSEIAAPSPGVSVNLTAADPTCVAVPPTVTIPTGLTEITVDASYGGSAVTQCTSTVTATGSNLVASSMTVRVDPAPNINLSATQVGSGLQRQWNGSLGASNHDGVTVRVTSTDPAKLLIAPDGNTVGAAFLDIPVASGSTGFGFWLQALEGQVGDVGVTVTAPGFNDRTTAMTLQQPALQLSGVNTSTTTLSGDDAFRVQIGLPYSTNSSLWQSMVVRAGAPPVTATITTSSSAVGQLVTATETAASVTVEIPAGGSISASSVATGGVALRPAGDGQTTVAATIPGYIATTAATSTVTVTTANINLSATQVGSGLQRAWSGSLGASDHSGVTVRVTSTDPTKLLIAPDGSTVGAAFLDIPVASGSTGFGFWLQALEGQVGDVDVTVTASGFSDRTTAMTLQQPALQLSGLSSNTTTLTGDDAFRVQIGLPYSSNSSLWQSMAVRAGAPSLDVGITSSTTAGQLITQSASGGSVSVQIPAGLSISPSSVTAGGVALRPLTAGTTTVTATAAGYITTTAGAQNVTISAPAISISNSIVGAGLQRQWSGNLGATNHSGVTVRITSSNAAYVLLAPDGATVGTAALDITVPAGQSGFSFWIQGVEGVTGTIGLTATASGFTDGSSTVEIVEPALQLTGLSSSSNTASADDVFRVQIGLPYDNHSSLWQSMVVRAGGSVTATLTSSDDTVGPLVTGSTTARTVDITIPAGASLSASSVATGGVAFRPSTAGSTTISSTIPGFIATSGASQTVTVAQASITVNNTTVGAGLQNSVGGSLSGPSHGGVTVRLTSSDPSRLLLAPDANTAGTSFIDVAVASGSTGFSYFVQGMEGTTGSVTVTASTAGFTDGVASHSVVQPAVEIIDLATSTLATAADDPFRVRVGVPNAGNTGFSLIQNVRVGSALTATVTSDAAAVGQLVTQASTGASVTVDVAGGTNTSASTVATGGAAFDPLTAGTVNIATSIPGFIQLPSAIRTITVSN